MTLLCASPPKSSKPISIPITRSAATSQGGWPRRVESVAPSGNPGILAGHLRDGDPIADTNDVERLRAERDALERHRGRAVP